MSRLAQQSFLGADSDEKLERATFGFVGLGGGGSHLIQQSAHVSVGGYVPADPDFVEDTNTNRLVGSTLEDVTAKTPKVEIAIRVIRGLMPQARIQPISGSWKDNLPALRSCDVILGAVDSFSEREQLERFARRSLIPHIDIGMDVHDLRADGHLISGQVFLSMPGFPCLRCCNIITDERLRREAERYGAAGSHPQVVWPNGVLASTAVGLAIQLITPWHPSPRAFAYLEYDGNRSTVTESRYMRQRWSQSCPHHPAHEAGDPLFDVHSHLYTRVALKPGAVQQAAITHPANGNP